MTGPEHYRQAEQLLDAAQDGYATDKRLEYAAMAQVHATLAAAALALAQNVPDDAAWISIAYVNSTVGGEADES